MQKRYVMNFYTKLFLLQAREDRALSRAEELCKQSYTRYLQSKVFLCNGKVYKQTDNTIEVYKSVDLALKAFKDHIGIIEDSLQTVVEEDFPKSSFLNSVEILSDNGPLFKRMFAFSNGTVVVVSEDKKEVYTTRSQALDELVKEKYGTAV